MLPYISKRHLAFAVSTLILVTGLLAVIHTFRQKTPDPVGLDAELVATLKEQAAELAELEEALKAEPPTLELVTLNLSRFSSFYEALRSVDIVPAEIFTIVAAAKPHQDLSRLPASAQINLSFVPENPDEPGWLQTVEVSQSALRSIFIQRSDLTSAWQSEVVIAKITQRPQTFSGVVRSSLWESANAAGMPFELIASLAEVFAWQIDFAREVRQNDRWRLVAYQQFANDEPIGWGRIVSAEYRTARQSHVAIWYESKDEGGPRGHFDEHGESLRKLFLRAPLQYARISSRFQRRRFHPILNEYRAHNGVDYAAPPGTPVRAVGDGTVIFAASRGGAGNHVQIRHNSTYETGYSHLRGFARGVRRGVRVEQGQIIGYVGSTGLATGPHLHFEFFENGRFVDPLGRKFPSADPIPESYLSDYLTVAERSLAKLPDWTDVDVADASDSDGSRL